MAFLGAVFMASSIDKGFLRERESFPRCPFEESPREGTLYRTNWWRKRRCRQAFLSSVSTQVIDDLE